MRANSILRGLTAAFWVAASSTMVAAQDGIEGLEIIGAPVDGAIGLQPASSTGAVKQQFLDNLLLVVCAIVVLFVVALLAIVIVRYNQRANKTPATFTHNSPLEVAWTIVPIAVLVVIGSFSLPVLFNQQEIPEADITIKATGNQWYWSYEYADQGFGFDSYMLGSNATLDSELDADVQPFILDDAMEALLARWGYSRDEFLLATDTAVVVPVNSTVVVQVTASDVIHSWAVPALGVKQDGVPGRLAELWFNADREGVYFGQCSELCGKDHTYMPITIKVVSQEEYDAWLLRATEEYAGLPQTLTVASID
ncbi:cytochrome c oxidase subunit II [Cochlodiniinecator piscidefendens]|uniref:cytochrome c oxidase subunit II n=1 Tax=Cochlodiniinecator piscidefendens TaxID=2715756 RepID=UPI00140D95A5|nr:cytochrome c oxidase subunit II [Cochlodiniinecator piscidefendens]